MPTSSNNPIGNEFIKMGRAALNQILGRGVGYSKPMSDEELKALKKDDDEFSEEEYLKLRQKIQAIYDEYRAQKRKEEEEKKRDEEQKQANQLARLYELRKGPIGAGADVKAAVSKGSAETGRNWGSE